MNKKTAFQIPRMAGKSAMNNAAEQAAEFAKALRNNGHWDSRVYDSAIFVHVGPEGCLMLTTSVPDLLNGQALREELAAAGIAIDRDDVVRQDDELRWTTLDEGDRATVEQVLAAHTGEPTADQQAENDRRDQLQAARTKARAVWRGEGTYTNAQAQKTIAGLVLLLTSDG